MDPTALVWIGGRVRRRDEVGVPVDDSAYADGRGCYTTARVRAGRPAFPERHVRRLERGARALALGGFDAGAVRHALFDLARAAFPDGEGVVRVQLSRGDPHARVVGIPRALDDDGLPWHVALVKRPHPGALVAGGHKLTDRLVHALALDEARELGADEALLADRNGFLVEGARSNLLVATADGALATPPLVRGAVSGIARELLRDRVPAWVERDLRPGDLWTAEAVWCTNAVRGARRVATVDGRPLADVPHPMDAALDAALEDE